jgi:hypothetical protein
VGSEDGGETFFTAGVLETCDFTLCTRATSGGVLRVNDFAGDGFDELDDVTSAGTISKCFHYPTLRQRKGEGMHTKQNHKPRARPSKDPKWVKMFIEKLSA